MTDHHDPFESLHRPNEPVRPPEAFASRLRAELARSSSTEVVASIPQRKRTMTTITPYLTFPDPEAAIAFYGAAFGAVEEMRLVDPKDGRFGHCELSIDGVKLQLASEYPEIGMRNPRSMGHDYTTFSLSLVVDDVDAVFARAVAAGATIQRPVVDQFYGDRSGTFTDPFGYVWTVSSPIETIDAAEMQRRYDETGE
jgi:PhnB protein